MILELLFKFLKYMYFFMIFISIPKGRNFLNSLLILKNYNIKLKYNIFRKIILNTNRKKIFIIIIKNKDLKKFLNYSFINVLFIGSDIIPKKIIKKLTIFFINSYLYINNNVLLLTKYFNLCNYYNLNFNIIKFNSSLEFFLKLKKNGIIDISETNKTLLQNNLFPKKFLKKIKLHIICNSLKKNIFKNIKNNVKNIK